MPTKLRLKINLNSNKDEFLNARAKIFRAKILDKDIYGYKCKTLAVYEASAYVGY